MATSSELEEHPEAYLPGCADSELDLADGSVFDGDCGVVMYDDAFEFEEVAQSSWSITSQMDVTPRMMWDFADWNVQFNHGTFFEHSGLSTSDQCDQANVAQSAWFTDVGPMLGSQNAAFDLWVKDMPPPLKKAEEVEETQEDGFVFVPDKNPYGQGKQEEGGVARFMRPRGQQSMSAHEVEKVPMKGEEALVAIQGEVGGSAVQDGNNYLMVTCIILLLLGIGLALYAYNHRKRKVDTLHSDHAEAYGSV